MKKLLSLFLLFAPFFLFAQDTTWKAVTIDNQLSISFPSELEKVDTSITVGGELYKVHAVKAATAHNILAVSVTPHDESFADQNDKGSLDETYKGFKEGFEGSIKKKNLFTTMTDTTVDNIRGVSAKVFSDASGGPIAMRNYSFLIGNKVYSVTVYPLSEETPDSHKELQQLISSIHFKIDPSQKKPPFSASNINWRKMGELIGQLSFYIVIAVIIIVAIVKNNKRKAQ
jgi:hypothetical protein